MKKITVTPEDIEKVILEHKADILECFNPNPGLLVERTANATGWEHVVFICLHCKELSEYDLRPVSGGFSVPRRCKNCGENIKAFLQEGHLTNAVANCVAIVRYDDSFYLAEFNTVYQFNDDLDYDIENSSLVFKALGFYDEASRTKTKYKISNNKFIKTAAYYTSLFMFGAWHFFDTASRKDDDSCRSAARSLIGKMDKGFEKKKKEAVCDAPPEADDCPTVALKEVEPITTHFVERDVLLSISTYKAHCNCCDREWMYSFKRDSHEVLQCPYCGTFEDNGGCYRNFCYITSDDDKITVKVVEVRATTDTDKRVSVESTAKLYFEFYSNSKWSGWCKDRVWDATIHSTVDKWKPAKYNALSTNRPLSKIYIETDEGLIKYKGVPEVAQKLVEDAKRQSFRACSGSTDLLTFIHDSLKYSVMEKVAKEGLISEWIDSKNKKAMYPISFNAKANTTYEAFSVTKPLLKYYKEAKAGEDTALTMHTLQKLYAMDDSISGHDAWWCDYHNVPLDKISSIKETLPELNVPQIISYLERVRLGQMFAPSTAVVQWRDYLEACKSIGMDMTDRHVLYPRALKTEHDIVVAKQQFIVDETKEDAFRDAVAKYSDLSYHRDDYFIKVPENMETMFEESRRLNHCCGRYVDDVIDGQAFVLFCRKKAAPDVPFLSIEVYPDMTVHQVRGKNDTPISVLKEKREVSDFLTHWAKMKHLELEIS